ncbi:DNA-processing protein DprA [Desulforamulus ruminis]
MIFHCSGLFPENKKVIAIVGPRRPPLEDPSSIQHLRDCHMAYTLARQAAKKGLVVLSGLATGIDTAAHNGCLDEGGITVAVVPFGLSAPVYPPENKDLAVKIMQRGGCLLSPFKSGQSTAKWTFVVRDKVQAMLSSKVLVVGTFPPDGIITGGTRHCARWARNLGKPLYHYLEMNGFYLVRKDCEILTKD